MVRYHTRTTTLTHNMRMRRGLALRPAYAKLSSTASQPSMGVAMAKKRIVRDKGAEKNKRIKRINRTERAMKRKERILAHTARG